MDEEDVHTYTVEYHAATGMSKRVPLAATQIDLEASILSEVREGKCMLSLMCGI